ncbi:uridine 5'-monophosphate synthase-like [Prorops nasuta]|uniref:uridine 5'-monophosphate synthase-like n=1 Tax=Prorops nasuta TaxID=863751 RepID=UPI0034D00FED
MLLSKNVLHQHTMDQELKELAVELFNANALKFGKFVTKAGLKTPIYFDLRVIIAHPKLMHYVSKALWKLSEKSSNITQICGVPYTAFPIATLMSVDSGLSLIIKRKETKGNCTKKLIEGNYSIGDHCVIIEDVITSGSSILETAQALRREGLKTPEAFIIIDREQGAKRNLENNGIQVKSLYTVTNLMKYLLEAKKVTAKIVDDVARYIKSCQTSAIQELPEKRLRMSFDERAKLAKNPISAKMFNIMEAKQSTLCLAADLTKSIDILELADLAGPHIIVLKTHIDIIEDFNDDFVKSLKILAKKHNFLLMEDRKFGDIGNTVSFQYRKGIYRIAEWADLITVHAVAGPGVIESLGKGFSVMSDSCGIFVVVQMSSKGALTTGDYLQSALNIAKSSEAVAGVVCQENVVSDPGLIQLTSGVKLEKSLDNLDQQYNTPESIVNAGADLAVLGRGITEAANKLATILEYKKELWNAYIRRLNKELLLNGIDKFDAFHVVDLIYVEDSIYMNYRIIVCARYDFGIKDCTNYANLPSSMPYLEIYTLRNICY